MPFLWYSFAPFSSHSSLITYLLRKTIELEWKLLLNPKRRFRKNNRFWISIAQTIIINLDASKEREGAIDFLLLCRKESYFFINDDEWKEIKKNFTRKESTGKGLKNRHFLLFCFTTWLNKEEWLKFESY